MFWCLDYFLLYFRLSFQQPQYRQYTTKTITNKLIHITITYITDLKIEE